jgi:hypothetical protein
MYTASVFEKRARQPMLDKHFKENIAKQGQLMHNIIVYLFNLYL